MYLPEIELEGKIFVPVEILSEHVKYTIRYLRKLARKGDIPGKKFRNKWYFNIDDVVARMYGTAKLNPKTNTYRKPI
jgi:hypothetical protein